jgi:hypothetical protein
LAAFDQQPAGKSHVFRQHHRKGHGSFRPED